MAETEPTLVQAYVGFVVGQMLPNHPRWRYVSQAQRWRLNAAAIKVVRLALSSEALHRPATASGAEASPCSCQPFPAALLKVHASRPVRRGVEASDRRRRIVDVVAQNSSASSQCMHACVRAE